MRPDSSPGGQKRPSFIEEARRAQIVAAARKTVAEVGYAHASLARIAETAGVSKSVISYHFAGKDDLLTQVVGEFFQETWDYMEARIQAEPTAAGKVAAWVGSQVAYLGSRRTEFLAVSDITINHRHPDGSRPFADEEDDEVLAIAAILRDGQAAGEFRDFDADSVATIILRSADGVLGSWTLDDRVDLDSRTESLIDFIHHAIRRDQS